MTSLSDFGRRMAGVTLRCLRGPCLPAERLAQLKRLCLDLIHDVPPGQKHSLVGRIDHAQRRRELWFLRSSLYRAISLQHGEQIARQRIRELDKQLRHKLH